MPCTRNQFEILDSLGARQIGNRWKARCPCVSNHRHGDTAPSLMIWLNEDGWLSAKCFRGCTRKEIRAASGYKLCAWGPESVHGGHPRGTKMACIAKTYEYRDEDGELWYQICRMDPKSFRARRPVQGGGWAWGLEAGWYYRTPEGDWRQGKDESKPCLELGKVPRIPYRIDKWAKTSKSQPILVVEGEKDADTLAGIGYQSTTLPGGSTDEDYFRLGGALSTRRVVIIPDNDRPGLEKAAKVAAACLLYGCESIRLCRWPKTTSESWDITDEIEFSAIALQMLPSHHQYKVTMRGVVNEFILSCSVEYGPRKAS
jgi:putative DNA primase/helicase